MSKRRRRKIENYRFFKNFFGNHPDCF